jgi:hypothetical protein
MGRVRRVFFFCCAEPGNLQEDVIALAEGLEELGVEYFSNCEYWLQSPDPRDYLFKHCPDVTPQDCDVVVVSYTWPQWVRMGTFEMRRQPLPQGLFRKDRNYVTVYMDNNDGYRTISWEPEYRHFDLILRSKFNSRIWHPENIRPWAYGLTKRIIEATDGALPFRSRRRAVLVNFGASHPFPYGARTLWRTRLERKISRILPLDRTTDNLSIEPVDCYEALMWRQTGGRFNRNYYKRIKETQAVACFCGDIIPCLPFRGADRYLVGGNRAKLRRALYWTLNRFAGCAPRAIGCDSFRFWETLAAGSAAINVDLGLYGVKLPVMPENGTHYLGVDFDHVDAFVGQLRDDPTLLGRVAKAGKSWAQVHYSPRAVAQRFLSLVCSDGDQKNVA